jgi:threonine synthase
VLCITGNGLKTTDVLTGVYETETPIAPKLAEFENYLKRTIDVGEVADAVGA